MRGAEARSRLAAARGIVVPDAGQHAAFGEHLAPEVRVVVGERQHADAQRRPTLTGIRFLSCVQHPTARPRIRHRHSLSAALVRAHDRLHDPHAAQRVACGVEPRRVACDARQPRRVLPLPERRARQRRHVPFGAEALGHDTPRVDPARCEATACPSRHRSPSGTGRSPPISVIDISCVTSVPSSSS